MTFFPDPCRGRVLPALLLAGLVSCGGGLEREQLLDTDEPVALREGPRAVSIHWRAPPPGTVEVFAGSAPDAIDRSRLRATLNEGRALIDELPPGRRPYFALVAADGSERIVAERLLPLEGAHNFRDLGGYPTSDGRHVRWGQLFRSDALAELTDDDLAYVSELGIALVCDFRGPGERESEPDRLPSDPAPEVALLPIADDLVDPNAIRESLESGDLGDLDFAGVLIEGNRRFATQFADRYRVMFDRILSSGGTPALVHCTGGKDRAGFASAMLLSALGVPRETVFRDFLATNVYTAEFIESTLRMIRFASLFRVDPERVRPMLEVHPAYLQAAFDVIDEQYGSLARYQREALGLDAERLDRLRAMLLH
jgi:protein-tyrosine phosphatase